MKHFGDITKLSGDVLPIVDVITGGSPCQDLSVAGKRAGLAGERSGLFMEQMRIVKEMRERDVRDGRPAQYVRPRYMVWENVPGAFSSGSPKGSDFQAVLEEIVRVVCKEATPVPIPKEGWPKSGCISGVGDSGCTFSIAWRVHDAQFWGVPQRRKRIALVADFGGLSAPEILFEREGLSGDSEQSGEAGEETAGAAGEGVEGAEYFGLDQQGGKGGANYTIGVAPTLAGDSHGTPHGVAYGISSYDSNSMKSPNPHSGIYEADTARTLDLNGGSPACNQGGIAVVQSVGCDVYNQEITGEVAASLTAACGGTNTSWAKVLSCGFKPRQGAAARSLGFEQEMSHTINTDENYAVLCLNDQGGSVMGVSEDVTGALRAEEHGHQPVVAFTQNQRNEVRDLGDIAGALAAEPGVHCRNGTENADTNGTLQAKENGGQSLNYQNTVRCGAIVRRLTPLECERLQGYPDGWTDIGEWVDSNGKKHKDADSPRYKAIGNSIALPFWAWLARRICAQYERPATMASLFDGIGGFPLAFQRSGAVPVWASEIEEFPIAVTKKHFPEE